MPISNFITFQPFWGDLFSFFLCGEVHFWRWDPVEWNWAINSRAASIAPSQTWDKISEATVTGTSLKMAWEFDLEP